MNNEIENMIPIGFTQLEPQCVVCRKRLSDMTQGVYIVRSWPICSIKCMKKLYNGSDLFASSL
jgi:hypothetical protein